MSTILSFMVVLGVLIFVHELGHFLLAKLMGVGVEKFSLGFGPKIVSKKIGMTDYMISAIPLGGYVKMVGESPESEVDESLAEMSFSNKGLLRRSLIVVAGPGFNLLLSVVIFFLIFLISGLPIMEPEVGEVQKDMPAYESGILPGDRIVSIDGNRLVRWEKMATLIKESQGHSLRIEVLRNGELIPLNVTPKLISSKNLLREEIQQYVIGVTHSGAFSVKKLSLVQAASNGVAQTWQIAKLTVMVVGKIIAGTVSVKTVGGPIMIAQLAGEQVREGVVNLIPFIAVLSVNLAIINLFPIPVLDGGHLLFFLIEAITRRPINVKMREMAQQVGIFLLILLMIFVFYNDIVRVFFD
jgi:regulator of sigma E protease